MASETKPENQTSDRTCRSCRWRDLSLDDPRCRAPACVVLPDGIYSGWTHPDEPSITVPEPATPLDVQVAGDHYKSLAIQPVEFCHANGIGFLEGSAIKYLTRWRDKNGVEDLRKARHFIDLLIELETRGSIAPFDPARN